jgi:hypothetical protein
MTAGEEPVRTIRRRPISRRGAGVVERGGLESHSSDFGNHGRLWPFPRSPRQSPCTPPPSPFALREPAVRATSPRSRSSPHSPLASRFSRSHSNRDSDFQSQPNRARCVGHGSESKTRGDRGSPLDPLCGSSGAKSCNCRPGYQAQVYSPTERRTIRRTFETLGDARAWRAETKAALERGSLRAPSRQTLAEAAEDWVKAANSGVIRTRSRCL